MPLTQPQWSCNGEAPPLCARRTVTESRKCLYYGSQFAAQVI